MRFVLYWILTNGLLIQTMSFTTTEASANRKTLPLTYLRYYNLFHAMDRLERSNPVLVQVQKENLQNFFVEVRNLAEQEAFYPRPCQVIAIGF